MTGTLPLPQGESAPDGYDCLSEVIMRNLRRAYLRFYDVSVFLGQIGRGYVRTKFTIAEFGRFPVIRGKVRLQIRGEAVFGERFTAAGDTWGVRIYVDRRARLTVGDHVALKGGVSIEVWNDVRIGDKVMIAPFVSIIDNDRHELEPGVPLYKGPTVIENNVWLASNVAILPGVTIGSGSVIGANSVVTRDIPPNCFAAGSPARVVRRINVPDGWSHRFGYEPNPAEGGIRSGLHRVFTGKDDSPAQAMSEAGRHHEVVG
jgi:acetyltransferase-like isoleucine patch superfamily enzyme